MASPSLESLLTTLAGSNVEFIVVGLLAAVAQGAPVTTHDLDIVHRRTPENIAKLLDVLVTTLDARYRGQRDRALLQTNRGPLDVLGAIEGGRDYDSLLPDSRRLDLAGHSVHVLGLRTLIELKRTSPRLKDQLVLPVLEETLRQSED